MRTRLAVCAAMMCAASAAVLTMPAPAAHAAAASVNSSPETAVAVPRLVRLPHPARPARHRAVTHRLRRGEYLSEVAQRWCGRADDWLGIWHATKPRLRDPNVVPAGLEVTIACNHRGPAYRPAAPSRRYRPGRAGKVWGVTYGFPYLCGDGDGDGYDIPCSRLHRGAAAGYRAAARRSRSSGGYRPVGESGFERCVIARESGGDDQVMNASGHYGLYQFSESTWVAYGGSAASFGHASAAEQRRVFLNAIAQGGQSNWSPYDGCRLGGPAGGQGTG